MVDLIKGKRTGFSRKDFIINTALGAGGIMLLGPFWASAAAEEVDPRVAHILANVTGVDMHNHVYPKGTEPHPHFGPPAGSTNKQGPDGPPARKRPEEQPDGPELFIESELKKSGFTAVCASFVLDQTPIQNAGDGLTTYLNWLTAIDAQLKKAGIKRALNLKDLQDAHNNGKPTIIQSIEGAQFIEGHLERVEDVYKRGLRHLQLLHEKDDMYVPLGDTNTGTAHLGGLTKFGAEVIKECNRLGVLIDLAHASNETVLGVLKVTDKPFIVSHTNLDTWTGKNLKMAEMMKPRLISKEHAKVVADAGGVIGIWTHLTESLPEFVESIKAMVDAIGIDHVGIGSDTDLLAAHKGGTNQAWTNLNGGFFTAVIAEMLSQGFSAEEIIKVGGGNFCRVFDKATAGH